MMTCDEAVRHMRNQPAYEALVREAYLGPDLPEAAGRFAASAEFREVVERVGPHVRGKRVLDLGAGTGIASHALVKAGAAEVVAVEPDPSPEVGRGAAERLTRGMPVSVVDAVGEKLPAADGTVDLVYCRQVLHHIMDLPAAMRECGRVLRSGGAFLACREHVADDGRQLAAFLAAHPVHQLTGGENAYALSQYTGAIEAGGMRLRDVLGPWDSMINAFPTVRDPEELRDLPGVRLRQRFGRLGGVLASAPGVRQWLWRRYRRPAPGRLYTFLAFKP